MFELHVNLILGTAIRIKVIRRSGFYYRECFDV